MKKLWQVIMNNKKQFITVLIFNLLLFLILVIYEISILTEISLKEFFTVVILTIYAIIYIDFTRDTIKGIKVKIGELDESIKE